MIFSPWWGGRLARQRWRRRAGEDARATGCKVFFHFPKNHTSFRASGAGGPQRPEAGVVADWPEMAEETPDFERNPIVRQVSREAGFSPNFHGLALPPAGKAGAGAGFQGDSESSRNGDHSAAGVVEE